jgi:hypothetical protein
MGPKELGVSSPEDRSRPSFRNVFSSYLEFRTMDKVQKSSDIESSVYDFFLRNLT